MSFLSIFGAISQREHDRIVARADAVIDSASAHLTAEEFNEGRSLPQKVAIAVKRLGEARSNAFKNRQRYLTAEAKLADVNAELAALRPDAQKWRGRKQADRDYRANKRRAG